MPHFKQDLHQQRVKLLEDLTMWQESKFALEQRVLEMLNSADASVVDDKEFIHSYHAIKVNFAQNYYVLNMRLDYSSFSAGI